MDSIDKLKWGFSVVVSLFLIIYLACAYPWTSSSHQIAQNVILTLTLIALIFYAAAVQSQLELARRPVVSFTIGDPPGTGLPTNDPPIYDQLKTPVLLVSQTDHDAAVRIDLDIYINGKLFKLGGDDFSGITPWNLQARTHIDTPGFAIGTELQQQTGMTRTHLVNLARQQQKPVDVKLEIKVTYSPANNLKKKLNKPTIRYNFDFEKDMWIFQVK
jgi:hypothetical protein